MAKQTKTEPKSQLDRIGEISPRYRDLLIKQAELLARQEAIKAEVGGGSPTRMRCRRKR
jgi:hypothetical protein